MSRTDWFNHEDASRAHVLLQDAGRHANAGCLDIALQDLEAVRRRLAKYRAKIRAAWRRQEKAKGNWCPSCHRFSQGATSHRRSCPTKAESGGVCDDCRSNGPHSTCGHWNGGAR